MAITKELTAIELRAQNQVSDAAGFKPLQFETPLACDTYNGFALGTFKELTFTSKKGMTGRINFALCEVEIDGKFVPVDVPIADNEIDNFIVDANVEFKVFHPENDDTLPKRVKMLSVDAVVNPPAAPAPAPTGRRGGN